MGWAIRRQAIVWVKWLAPFAYLATALVFARVLFLVSSLTAPAGSPFDLVYWLLALLALLLLSGFCTLALARDRKARKRH